MNAARKALSKLSSFATKFNFQPSRGNELHFDFGPFAPVQEALLNDLNTPEALGCCFIVIRELVEAFDRGEYEGNVKALIEVRLGFQATCDAFGFVVHPIEENIERAPPEIIEIANRRWEAKQTKDWSSADQLRDELLALGWVVKDSKDDYSLTKSLP